MTRTQSSSTPELICATWSGPHIIKMHAPFFGVQMLQLELQQVKPFLQNLVPHGTLPSSPHGCVDGLLDGGTVNAGAWVSCAGVGSLAPSRTTSDWGSSRCDTGRAAPQNCCVHAPPMGAQTPQLRLQQKWLSSQTLVPHRWLSRLGRGTQVALPFRAWHTVPVRHRVTMHGS